MESEAVRLGSDNGQALLEAGSAPRGAGQQKENNQSNEKAIQTMWEFVNIILTRREWFAMAAMQGLLANPHYATDKHFDEEIAAEWACNHAEALIAELDAHPNP